MEKNDQHTDESFENLGFIKLHRELLHDRLLLDEGLLQMWIYFYMKASYKERWENIFTGKGKQQIKLKPGQLIHGRYKTAEALSTYRSTVRNRVQKLEKLGYITVEPTHQYSIITVCHWDYYQGQNPKGGHPKTNQKPTKEQPTANKRTQTRKVKKEKKNVKNDKETPDEPSSGKDEAEKSQVEAIKDYYNQVCVNLRSVKILNQKRQQAVKARINEYGFEAVKEVIDIASKNDFLNGGGAKGWTANFDWLMNPDNFLKVWEGHYETSNKSHKDQKPVMTAKDYENLSLADKKKLDHPIKLRGYSPNEVLICEAPGRKLITEERYDKHLKIYAYHGDEKGAELIRTYGTDRVYQSLNEAGESE